jgi:hypothetical protein
MKKYILITALLVILGVLFFTNLNQTAHTTAVKEILTKELNKKLTAELAKNKSGSQSLGAGLGLMFGATFIDRAVDAYVERENFYLFSLTKIKYEGKEHYIGTGVFGNVYISDRLKEYVGEFLAGKKL